MIDDRIVFWWILLFVFSENIAFKRFIIFARFSSLKY